MHAPPPSSAAPPAPTPSRVMAAGAVGLVLALVSTWIGGTWDVQWHVDVGPDTFFTAPHLFIYAGAAVAGLSSLAVVLHLTWWVRGGHADTDRVGVPVLGGRFHGPVGFVVAGTGSAIYLAAGLYDQWWHYIFGFDAVLDSPPHIMLGLADLITIAGAVIALAMLATRPRGDRRGSPAARFGLCLVAALVLLGTAGWQASFLMPLPGGLTGDTVFVALVYPLVLFLVASTLRRPGAATLVALLYTALMALGWAFSTWATTAYAAALGLFVRDDAVGYPQMIAILPKAVLAAAVVVDLGLLVARRGGAPVRSTVVALAAVATAVLVLLDTTVSAALAVEGSVGVLAATAAGAALGAVAGWTGWKAGVILRRLPGAGDAPARAATTSRGVR